MFLIFYFSIYYYRNYHIIKKSDLYEAKNLVVNSLTMVTTRSRATSESSAEGEIDGERKGIIIDANEMKVGIGNCIRVWSAPGSYIVLLRSQDETEFYSEKFEKENNLILYLLFIPTIIVWVSERIISGKIRKLKKNEA